MTDIQTYAQKLIDLYDSMLNISEYTDINDRLSFSETLGLNGVNHIIFDYSYDGNCEKSKVAIVFNKDIFKMSVEKTHKNNDICWELL